MCTCMYCINRFFIDNIVRLLFYVNMCACHVYFTTNLLTYLTYLLTYYNQVGLYTGMLVLWDYLA